MTHPAMALTESVFQGQVIDIAHAFGWRVAHFRPAKTDRGWRTAVQADGVGYPDLTLVRGPELLFAELKADKGRVSDEQQAWHDALRLVQAAVDDLAAHLIGTAGAQQPPAAVEMHVWRPADFDAITARLRRRPAASAVRPRSRGIR